MNILQNKKKWTIPIVLGIVFAVASSLFSANIDAVEKYGWGAAAGWVNFNPTMGAVTVTDTEMTGNIWSDNYGWINLQPTTAGVTNNCAGNLSGHGWGDTAGWVDFTNASIDQTTGYFQGTITGDNFGVVNLTGASAGTSIAVKTDWACIPVITSPAPLMLVDGVAVIPVTGTATPGNTVNVTLDGTDTCTALVDGSGNWTCNITPTVADGVKTITATTENPADPGILSPADNTSVVIDATPPQIPSVDVDTSGGINNPTLTFSSIDNVAVDYYEIDYNADDGGVGTGTPTTITPAISPLALALDPDEPVHTVTVRVFDTAGNSSESIVKFPPIINVTAPTQLSNVDIADSTFTVDSPDGNPITNITILSSNGPAPAIVCTGSDAGTIDPYTNIATCTIGPVTQSTTLTLGGEDSVTGAVGQKMQSYVIDTVVPVVTITAPTKSDNTNITDTTITVTDDVAIDVSDVAANIINSTGTIDESAVSCTQTTNTQVDCTVTIGGEGTGDLQVNATDKAGNAAIGNETGYEIDLTSPVISEVTAVPTPGNDATPDYIFTTDEAGTIAYGGSCLSATNLAVVGNNTVTFNSLPDGAYSDCTVTVTDSFGNISNVISITPFVIDTVVALPTVTGPIHNSTTNDTTPTFTGTGEVGATIVVDDGAGHTCTTLVTAGGTWSCDISPALNNGDTPTFNVTQDDLAGNGPTAPILVSLTIDTSAPNAPEITGPLSTSTNPIVGTGEVGATINITGIVCDNAPVIVDGAGNWSCDIITSGPLVEGQTIIATQTDPSGNTSGSDVETVPVTSQSGGSSGPRSSSSSSGTNYTCKDSTASNFSNTGTHKASLCEYDDEGAEENITTTPSSSLGEGQQCSADQIITQNMKAGDRNGNYSSWEKNTIDEVKILQAHMNRLGFESGPVDGILGPITDGAIKRMQKFLGTFQDGLVGPITRSLINNSCGEVEEPVVEEVEDAKCFINYIRLIKRGMTGSDVKQAQVCVASLGHPTGPFDGIYGGLTYAGIRSYQQANNLLLDGIIGPETAGHLNALSGMQLDGITPLN